VAQVHGGYIVYKIVKESRDFFHKVAAGFFSVFFEINQYISAGFWLDKLLMESQLNHNVSAGYIAPCAQCI
jgi:hypothetical protein